MRLVKILLIEPSRYLAHNKLLKVKRLIFPSITLPLLAALTPSDIDISIIMEQFEDINFDEEVDLVGISACTSRALRGYEIADEFRRRGVPVVMGGIHVSMQPEEAQEYADTIIIGEAEGIWQKFIADFKQGISKKVYIARDKPSLNNLPIPRFSLIEKYKSRYSSFNRGVLGRFLPLPLFPIQTARGCPHNCDFCAVTAFSGGKYRERPVSDVINEIKSLDAKSCFFLDDNIFGNPSRAKELFKALIPLKILWFGQATISNAEDKELIQLARKSGCILLYIGLESISHRHLSSIGKTFNKVEKYESNLRTYRQEGISVVASMIFGFDYEESTVFKEVYDFLVKNRIPYTQWQFITPYPGTPFLKKLEEQGRLKDNKWWLNHRLVWNPFYLKYTGIKMKEEEFCTNFHHYYSRFYSLKCIIKRILFPPQARFILKIPSNLAIRNKLSSQTTVIEGKLSKGRSYYEK